MGRTPHVRQRLPPELAGLQSLFDNAVKKSWPKLPPKKRRQHETIRDACRLAPKCSHKEESISEFGLPSAKRLSSCSKAPLAKLGRGAKRFPCSASLLVTGRSGCPKQGQARAIGC